MNAQKLTEMVRYIHYNKKVRLIDMKLRFKISRATFFRFIHIAWDSLNVEIIFEKDGYVISSYGIIDKLKL
jgi:hypothetical protein